MNIGEIKSKVFNTGLSYLDNHKCGEGIVISALATVATPADIGKGFKRVYMESHKLHVRDGHLDSAAAALHLAADLNHGMEKQEKTFQRRRELVTGIVHGRQRNVMRSQEE